MKIEDALKLNIPCGFGTGDYDEETDSISFVFEQLDSTVNTLWGVTQFVIISEEWDKVVKIPFDCFYDYNEDGDYVANYFDTNYAERSFYIYDQAKRFDISPIFAKMEYLGRSVSNTPIYLQEKIQSTFCDDTSRTSRTYSQKSYDKASEICKERASLWKYFPLNWLAAAIDYYGFELVENFINFCDENNIRDWHSANYGWREDGSPVVIDWGGYLDD